MFFDALALKKAPSRATSSSPIKARPKSSPILDEFGVYAFDSQQRKAIYEDVYYNAMFYKYEQDLLFADGFDGLYLTESIQFTESELKNSEAVINPQGFIQFPDFEITETVNSVVINIKSNESSKLTYLFASGENSFQFTVNKEDETIIQLDPHYPDCYCRLCSGAKRCRRFNRPGQCCGS